MNICPPDFKYRVRGRDMAGGRRGAWRVRTRWRRARLGRCSPTLAAIFIASIHVGIGVDTTCYASLLTIEDDILAVESTARGTHVEGEDRDNRRVDHCS